MTPWWLKSHWLPKSCWYFLLRKGLQVQFLCAYYKVLFLPQTVCVLLLGNIWFRTMIELTSGKNFEWIQTWESLLFLWLGLHESLLGRNGFNYLCLICFIWNSTVCVRSVTLLNNTSAILFILVLAFLCRYTPSFTLLLRLTTLCSFSYQLWESLSRPQRIDNLQFIL